MLTCVSTRALRLLDADALLTSGAVRLRRPDLWALKALRARPRCARCGCAWCEAFECESARRRCGNPGGAAGGPGVSPGSGRGSLEIKFEQLERRVTCRPAKMLSKW